MNTAISYASGYEPRSLEYLKVEDIFQHFKREFPADPVGSFARFYAKPSCRHCNGKGLQTVLNLDSGHGADELRLCECARRRLARFIMTAVVFDAALHSGGLAFAEGTVCHEPELRLPTGAAAAGGPSVTRASSTAAP